MKRFTISLLTSFFLVLTFAGLSQKTIDLQAKEILNKRGEIYFKFLNDNSIDMNYLSKFISIDHSGKEIYAYANEAGFLKFLETGIAYEVLIAPSMQFPISAYTMEEGAKDDHNRTVWNFYPTYDQYVSYMVSFAASNPQICKLDTIGTSIQGRLLLMLKISDSVQFDRGKPQVLLTSSIHGDETTGYVLMLHLIDYILSNYGTDPRITALVNNTQLFINPLSNPDGTYHGGNNSVYGATRFNANNIDLNRNYPDPVDGPHPDGNAWQKETVAFMALADSNHFNLSMNFHGGSEVYNYPWDTWAKLHPDDTWLNFTGREYADTVHKYSPVGYFDDEQNGVTNGYAWYRITGGRQDYMTYFQHGREITLEISAIKTLPTSQLLNFWEYNYRSFLNFIEQSSYGIDGQVTDSVTGQPLNAKINIFNHDADNSFVYSYLPSGYYFRMIDQGTYNLTFSCQGYFTKTISDVSASRYASTPLNVKLIPLNIGGMDENNASGITVFPNPAKDILHVQASGRGQAIEFLSIYTLNGQRYYPMVKMINATTFDVDISMLSKGTYLLSLREGSKTLEKKFIVK